MIKWMSFIAVLLTSSVAAEEAKKDGDYGLIHQAIERLENRERNPLSSNEDYTLAFVQLDGKGAKEVLVIFHSANYRGSGGCTMMVIQQKNEEHYKVVSKLTLCRKDRVWVSSKKSNGWRDLIIEVSGGGLKPTLFRVSHNGVTYPRNPSTQKEFVAAGDKLEAGKFQKVPQG